MQFFLCNEYFKLHVETTSSNIKGQAPAAKPILIIIQVKGLNIYPFYDVKGSLEADLLLHWSVRYVQINYTLGQYQSRMGCYDNNTTVVTPFQSDIPPIQS